MCRSLAFSSSSTRTQAALSFSTIQKTLFNYNEVTFIYSGSCTHMPHQVAVVGTFSNFHDPIPLKRAWFDGEPTFVLVCHLCGSHWGDAPVQIHCGRWGSDQRSSESAADCHGQWSCLVTLFHRVVRDVSPMLRFAQNASRGKRSKKRKCSVPPDLITSEDNAWDLAISALMKIPAGRRKVQTAKGQFASQTNAIYRTSILDCLLISMIFYNRRIFSECHSAPVENPMSESTALRKVVHVDMDAFPTLLRRTTGQIRVCSRADLSSLPGAANDPVVCAASYEARHFGVRSAMPAIRAERMCPQAVFIPPDFVRYKAASQAVREILQRHTDLIEPLSLRRSLPRCDLPRIRCTSPLQPVSRR